MWREARPLSTIMVYIFPSDRGFGHLVKVEGQLPATLALRLAVRAIVDRLAKGIV
ncbi:MAG: hypothetical protein Kow0031_08030 [Anaerolineae bacterium]